MPTIHQHPAPLAGEETHRLIDIAGVIRDLQITSAMAKRLLRELKKNPPDWQIVEPLGDSAPIRYGRCFKSGVRLAFRIPQAWIDKLPSKLRAAHKDFLDLRSTHIAHSVNDWELDQAVARINIDLDTNEATIASVGVTQQRLKLADSVLLETLDKLATTLVRKSEEARTNEEQRLLAIVKPTSAEDLLRRNRGKEPTLLGQQKVGIRRKRP